MDPPGDRLLKWHIAGTSSVTPRPFTSLLVENYRKLMLRQVAENKISNLKTVLGDDSHLPKSFADTLRGVLTGGSAGANTISNSSVKVRGAKGFYFLPELDVLTLGLFAIPAGFIPRFRDAAWRCSVVAAAWVGLTIFVWCALMFIPESTVLHQGSYVAVLLAYAACLSAAWAVSAPFAVTLGLLHLVINLVYYVLFLHVDGAGDLPEHACWRGVLVFAVMAAVAVVYQLFRMTATRTHITA